MSQDATTIPPSGLGKLSLNDFWKSLLLAALTNVLLGVYTIVQSGNFPTHSDWATMLKSTIAIVISYLLKNLSTNNVGQILSKDKPTVTVDAKQASAVDISTVPKP